jgi:hypothetical protein
MWKRWVFRMMFVPIALWMVLMGIVFRTAKYIAAVADYLGGALPDRFERWCLKNDQKSTDTRPN